MTVRDSLGNVAVDFVWGNLPMQPDDDRGGEGQSDTLDPALDNHIIATTGYSNFPQYIPNYEGDEDTDLEVVVPNFVRLTLSAGDDLATANSLQLYTFAHHLEASYIESTGKTVRVTAYDHEYGNWSNASGAALNGLRVGDEVDLSELTDDSDPAVSFELGIVKVTRVNDDGDNSWFEFKSSTNLELDSVAVGNVWGGPNLVNVITVQRPNQTAPGDIVNEGRNVNVRYFDNIL